MNTRCASRLALALACSVVLRGACVAAVCAPDTLTNYVNNVKICTYNSRTFSMFKVVQAVAIDPDDITVTPIKNQTYVGLEITGFGKAKQPNYALQVSYQVNALDGDGKASTPFSEVLLNLDGISAGGGTTAFGGLAYTIAQDSDSVSVPGKYSSAQRETRGSGV